jgi:hypothetical protein
MIIIEHNIETNEIIERTMTAAEQKELLAVQAQFTKEQEAKEVAKQGVLDKLGLTAEELKAALS